MGIGTGAFYFNQEITSVTIPDSVTSIGKSAFGDCQNLTDIVFNNKLEEIGSYAFENTKIKKVGIPSDVKKILEGTFRGCAALEKVTLNEGLLEIGTSAFANTGIKEITLPSTVKTLGINAFSECKSLTKASLNQGLEKIPNSLFRGSILLNEINIPASVTAIGSNAFAKTGVESIVIPGSIKEIAVETFLDCTKLSSVTLSEGLEIIKARAFQGASFSEIVIPSTIRTIESDVVKNNVNLKKVIINLNEEDVSSSPAADKVYINPGAWTNSPVPEVIYAGRIADDVKTPAESGYEFDDKTGTITKYNGSEVKITIPEKFKIFNGTEEKIVLVERIGEKAFKDNKIIESVIISRGIKSIGKLAFDKCSNLQEVTLYDGLEIIEDGAFYEAKIKEIEIPGTVNSIGNSAFYKCIELTSVILKPGTIISGIKEIGKNAFEETAVKKIEIPASVKTIGDKAFYNCSSLTDLTLNYGLEEIGKEAFSKTPLTKLDFPASVITAGEKAFYGCMVLKDVNIRSRLTEISDGLFGNTVIEEIQLPENVRFIGKGAFSDTNLKKITISGRVEIISEEAFKGCTVLEEVTIKEGVKEILKAAFSGTAIKEVVVPSTITNLAPDAFPSGIKITHAEVTDEGENVIADPILKMMINESMGRENLYAVVTESDLENLKALNQSSALNGDELWQMKSIKDLERAVKLKNISLVGTDVTDLSPLKNLPLESIEIMGEYIGSDPELKGGKLSLTDISPLGYIETLTNIRIYNTKLEDIKPLGNLKNIIDLYIPNNEIFDITVLKDIPIGNRMIISGNCIADFSILKGKPGFHFSTSGYQRVTIVAESKLFDNPLRDENGKCFNIFDNEYVKNEGEKIRILKLPEGNKPIIVKYGYAEAENTLTIKLSIADVISDPVLKKAVNLYRNAVYKEKRPVDQMVTKNELEEMTEFNLNYITEDEKKLITDISGLEYLSKVTELNLKGTSVINLASIGSLTNLKKILLGGSYEGSNLGYNNTKWRAPLKDIGPLAGLVNLEDIYINDSEVVDVSPLKDLKKISVLYLMRNKIESAEEIKDVPVASGLYLQGNCIGNLAVLNDKSAVKSYLGQSVRVSPDTAEFANPLRNIKGDFVILPVNEYIINTGDKNEKLKVLKIPAEGNSILVEYDITEGGKSTLLTDISSIRTEFGKQQVSFKVMKTDGGTISNARIQLWNDKKEEMLNEGAAPYAWTLADGSYTYKASLDGYAVKEGFFTVKGAALTVEVRMTPIQTDNPGGGGTGGGGTGAPLPAEEVTEPVPEEIPANLKYEKEIKLENGSVKISPYTFDGKVMFTAKEEKSYLELKAVDEKGNNAEVKKPLFVEVKYEGQVKNPDNVTVVFIDENGHEESAGGIYDAAAGTVKFITNKLGKFIVREGSKEFSDTSEVEWAKTAIESLAVKGIMNGKSEDLFAPSDNITRAEFAALISRMMKLNENAQSGISFGDVTSDKWYYGPVAAVYEEGLINGKSSEVFDPNGNITRQEMAKIIGGLLRINYENKQGAYKLTEFKDADLIADWAKDSVGAAVNSGVIVGIDGSFMPDKNATRAEAAVMIYRLYSLFMDR